MVSLSKQKTEQKKSYTIRTQLAKPIFTIVWLTYQVCKTLSMSFEGGTYG